MSELSNALVCLLGIGTVFVGLSMIVLFCLLMSRLVRLSGQDLSPSQAQSESKARQPDTARQAEDSARLEVAVTAALAEMLHTEFANIHIASIVPVDF